MQSQNPYEAPTAPLSNPTPKVPEEILKKIKQAWIAGTVSASVTLVVTLLAISGTEILGFTVWELFDVALIAGLTYGIYRKSRTCAVLMLLYFIASKIFIMIETGKPTGLVLGILFAYFYWQGVSGTFSYHRFLKNPRRPAFSRG